MKKMGSVQSDVQCRKCKFPYAWEDYYYKSGEVFIFCDRCGYCYNGHWKLSGGEYAKDKAGNRIPLTEISGGVGTSHIFNKRGFGQGANFRTHKDRRKFARYYFKNRRKYEDKLRVFFTMKINGKWFIINAFTEEKKEIANNINYHQWMNYRGGNLKEVKLCKVCDGAGGKKLEGSDEKSWEECPDCKGQGVIE